MEAAAGLVLSPLKFWPLSLWGTYLNGGEGTFDHVVFLQMLGGCMFLRQIILFQVYATPVSSFYQYDCTCVCWLQEDCIGQLIRKH